MNIKSFYSLSDTLQNDIKSDIDDVKIRQNCWICLKTFEAYSTDFFMTSSMSDFYIILQVLATTSVIECVETLNLHIEYVF